MEELHVRVDAAATDNVVENSGLKENSNTNNESAQVDVVEKLLSTQEGCEGQEAIVDQSVHVDKNTGVDTSRWEDLEKMTLGDFFYYLEWKLPKEIREKTEEIISRLPVNTGRLGFRMKKVRVNKLWTKIGENQS